MALIDDVATFLQAAGVGTVGTDIFKGYQPETPDACVTLYATGGYPLSEYLPVETPTLQALIRAANYAAAQTKAFAVVDALHPKQDSPPLLALVSGKVRVRAMQPPASIGKDEQGRHEFSVNFEFRKAR